MTDTRLSLEEAFQLSCRILENHNTGQENARCVSRALVAAERDGQKGHGLARLPSYAGQSASGKVNGRAKPEVVDRRRAAVRVDAAFGFAFPACELAVQEVASMAPESGIAAAGIFRSHHFGQAGYHVEMLAEQGLVGLAFGNSPRAIAPWGGNQGIFGTNPVAFAVPRVPHAPLVIDMSLSKVARGKVMLAAENGESIPKDWALDGEGRPTTDPGAALGGTMLPMGGSKGAALVLMVEILAATLTGANYGYEATSFFQPDGEPPGVGHFLIAIDGSFFSGDSYGPRLDALVDAILAQEGTRLPGSRRLDSRRCAREQGLQIPDNLYQKLHALV